MDDSAAFRAGKYTELYEVSGTLKSGARLDTQIINASSRRNAMLAVLRDMGGEMHEVVSIDAVSVS